MPFTHGKSTRVLFNEFDLSAFFNEAGASTSQEPAETTTFQAAGAAKTFVLGLNEGSISLKGLFDGSVDAVDEEFAAAINASAASVLTVGPAGLANGNRVFSAAGWEASYEITSPVADVVAVSAEFTGTGGARGGVSLLDVISVVNVTGNTAGVNDRTMGVGVSTTNGGYAVMHVVTNTRNGTIDMKLADSDDNAAWVDLAGAAFTQIPASTKTSQRIAFTGTVRRFVRATYTVAGTTGSANINVNFIRY